MRKEKKNLKGGWLPQILCGLMLSFTMFLFGPIDMYMANASDFWFGLEHFAHVSALLFVAVFVLFELVFFLIRRFLPRPVYLILLATTFGVSLMLYVQGNWLCMANKVMEGTQPTWNKLNNAMMLDLFVWFAAILGSILFVVLKPKPFMKLVVAACALVLVMEGVALTANLISFTANDDPVAGEIYTSVKDRFTVSDNGDVLIFMVDTLDTRIMDEVMADHPEYLSELDGFTYYRNTGGIFNKTQPSVTGMLTGRICKNEEPFFYFSNKAFAENDLFPALQEEGFTIDIYGTPNGLMGEEMFGVVDNLAVRDSKVKNYFRFMFKIQRMVSYRYMPGFAQPFLYSNYKDELYNLQAFKSGTLEAATENDAGTYASLKKNGITEDDSRRFFKFYKMLGSHRPYTLNREGVKVAEGSVTEMDQTLGVFTIIGDYFSRLKQQDLYDSSTIIILADHGRCNERLHSAPSMLVKYPNERSNGEIRVSEAPTSLLDMRATAAYGAGIENYADFGTPAHEWEGVAERERYYYTFEWKPFHGYTFWMSDIVENVVPADAKDYKNYEPTGVVYSKEK